MPVLCRKIKPSKSKFYLKRSKVFKVRAEKNLFKKRIVFFGTKGWDLTNRHLEFFMQLKANIVSFVIDSSSSFASTVKKSQTYEDICSISLKENIPAIYLKDIKDPGLLNELKKLNADIFIVCGLQYFLNIA